MNGKKENVVWEEIFSSAKNCYDEGILDEALEKAQQAANTAKETYGKNTSQYAKSLQLILDIYETIEDDENALLVCGELVDIYSSVFGEQHSTTKWIKQKYVKIFNRISEKFCKECGRELSEKGICNFCSNPLEYSTAVSSSYIIRCNICKKPTTSCRCIVPEKGKFLKVLYSRKVIRYIATLILPAIISVVGYKHFLNRKQNPPQENSKFQEQKIKKEEPSVPFSDETKKVQEVEKKKEENKALSKKEGQLPKIKEEKEAEFDEVGNVITSPHGNYKWFKAKKGNKWILVINGQRSTEYDSVSDLQFLSNEKTDIKAYFIARKGKKYVLVIDGNESEEYDEISDIIFNKDGSKYAFVAKKGNKSVVVFEGTEGNEYDTITQLRFTSEDKIEYQGIRDNTTYKVINFKELEEYIPTGPTIVSKNGTISGFKATKSGKQLVIINEKESKLYDKVTNPSFSPAGKRVWFIAKENDKLMYVIDGVEYGKYSALKKIVFDKKFKNWAFCAKKGGKWVVVKNGIESTIYDEIGKLRFHKSKLIFKAKIHNKWIVVVDMKEEERLYDEIEQIGFKRGKLWYIAQKEGKKVLVYANKESGKFDSLSYPSFDQLGKLFFVGKRNNKEVLVVDWKESKEYDAIYLPYQYLGKKVLWFTAVRNKKTILVIDWKESKEYDEVTTPLMDYTEESIWFKGKVGKKEAIIINGKESKLYDKIDGPSFTTVGKKSIVWFKGIEGKKQYIVINGKESKGYDSIDEPYFKMDGELSFFTATENNESFIVCKDKEYKQYKISGLLKTTPCKDPQMQAEILNTSCQHWFLTQKGPKEVLVIDCKEGPSYDKISDINFSADGTFYVFVGKRGDKYVVVQNGKESKEYLKIEDLILRPNNSVIFKALVGYSTAKEEKWVLVVNGVESPPYREIGDIVFSPDGKRMGYRVEYLTEIKKSNYSYTTIRARIILDGTPLKEYDMVYNLVFSSDSKSYAYKAREGDKEFIVMNGKESSRYPRVTDPIFTPDNKAVDFQVFLNLSDLANKKTVRFENGVETILKQ